jgi:tetratricopeptide (TPR) repeat protein
MTNGSRNLDIDKNVMIMKRILFVFGILLMSFSAQAQESKWGNSIADSVSCFQNYNIMGSYYQSKDYAEAYDAWKALYETCPSANIRIYTYGDNIIEAKIKEASDDATKNVLIQELLSLYDAFAVHFPKEKANAISSKAYHFYNYYRKNSDSVSKAVVMFEEAKSLLGDSMSVAHTYGYFQANVKEFNKTKDVNRLFEVYNSVLVTLEFDFNTFNVENYNIQLKADSVLDFIAYADSIRPATEVAKAEFDAKLAIYDSTNAYNNSSKKRIKKAAKLPPLVKPELDATTQELVSVLEKADELRTKYELDEQGLTSVDKRKISNNEIRLRNITKVQRNIEKILSPLLTCEKLTLIYNDAAFEENKDDIEWLKRAGNLLQKERVGDDGELTSCTDNPVFISIAETLYELEPSAQAALKMAKLDVNKGDWAMAKKYYTEAIEQEEDLRRKANTYMGLAYVNQKMGALSSAKSNCLKAGQLRKNWGSPYLYLATIYADAAGSCGSNAVEKNAVYWAAINKLSYARSIDPSIADKAAKLISAYSQQIPDKGISFQLGYKEGDKINIGCWINETVSVKFY